MSTLFLCWDEYFLLYICLVHLSLFHRIKHTLCLGSCRLNFKRTSAAAMTLYQNWANKFSRSYWHAARWGQTFSLILILLSKSRKRTISGAIAGRRWLVQPDLVGPWQNQGEKNMNEQFLQHSFYFLCLQCERVVIPHWHLFFPALANRQVVNKKIFIAQTSIHFGFR